MRRARVWVSGFLVAVAVSAALSVPLGCGGGSPLKVVGASQGSLSGLVLKGPVAGGLVTAYRLSEAVERGAVLGSATTDEAGRFEMQIPSWHGPVLLVASGGSYVEEAVGVPVRLEGQELSLVLPAFKSGSKVSGLRVTPVSTWARALVEHNVRVQGRELGAASDEAWEHLNRHFGDIDWRAVTPAEVAVPDAGAASLSPDVKAGLVLSALSFLARMMSVQSGLTPATNVTAASLVSELGKDLAADGTFDGRASDAALWQGKVALTGQTPRLGLAQALGAFIESDRNGSRLAPVDVRSLQNALTATSDPYLFCLDKAVDGACRKTVDTEPPQLSFAVPVSRYTNADKLKVSVLAVDEGAGVSRVFLQVDSEVPKAMDLSQGVWSAEVALGASDGAHVLQVWAQDDASPANSGKDRPPPYSLKADVLRDTQKPEVAVAGAASYRDEQQLGVVLLSGAPKVPVEYTFSGSASAPVEVAPGGRVYKSATRLACGEDLEGANPENTPFIQYSVKYSAPYQAPIVSVGYEVVPADCEGDCVPLRGALEPSAKVESGLVFFTFPLCERTGFTTSKTVAFTLTFKDAAGNATTRTDSVEFHVVGPPVHFEEDSTYRQRADEKSIYGYHATMTGNAPVSFHSLFDVNNQDLPGGMARVNRLVIKNPAPVPVGIRFSDVETQTVKFWISESWKNVITQLPLGPFTADGFPFVSRYQWNTHPDEASGVTTHCAGQYDAPCGQGSRSLFVAYHYAGSPTRMVCDAAVDAPVAGVTPWVNTVKAVGFTASAFKDFSSSYAESNPADVASVPLGGGISAVERYFVVPAASDTTPGTLVVYLAVPIQRNQGTPDPLVQGVATGYGYRKAYFWKYGRSTNSCTVTHNIDEYDAQDWWRELVAAGSTHSRVLAVSAAGIRQRSQPEAFGESRSSTYRIQQTFSH